MLPRRRRQLPILQQVRILSQLVLQPLLGVSLLPMRRPICRRVERPVAEIALVERFPGVRRHVLLERELALEGFAAHGTAAVSAPVLGLVVPQGHHVFALLAADVARLGTGVEQHVLPVVLLVDPGEGGKFHQLHGDFASLDLDLISIPFLFDADSVLV